MKIAFLGCGYVADFYARNLRSHPGLEVVACYDRDPARLAAFCAFYKLPAVASFDAMIVSGAEIVLNLTNPRDHFVVSSAIIAAGLHVYSEKPLGMDRDEAMLLVELAHAAGVRLGAAPCNMLNPTTQAVKRAIADDVIGTVRLAYANYDDGMIAPHERPWHWRSESGAPWPAKDEFEIGCTYEHAGYYLTVLAELFGPATAVTAFSHTCIPDKGIPVDAMAPDFSVGCIEYRNGVVARVTAGLVAPEDKSLTVVGDKGVLLIRQLRNDREEILTSSRGGLIGIARRIARRAGVPIGDFGKYRRLVKPAGKDAMAGPKKPVDFLLGVDDMATSIEAGRPHRLSAEFALHIVEMTEALQYPERFQHRRVLTTSF